MSSAITFELPGFSNGYDGNLMPADDVKTPEQLAKDIPTEDLVEPCDQEHCSSGFTLNANHCNQTST